MTWTKLDDGFPSHPKVMGLTDGGFRALVTGLCYSNQYLTDGFIPAGVVKTRYAVELCAKHIWTLDPRGGYAIHDFLEYNRSKAEVVSERDARKQAGKRGGVAKALASASADAVANAKHGGSEDFYPVPSRPVPTQDAESKTPAEPVIDTQPTHDQLYLAGKFDLSPASVKKLNRRHGTVPVLEALRQLADSPPTEPLRDPYPWLDTVAAFKAAGAA